MTETIKYSFNRDDLEDTYNVISIKMASEFAKLLYEKYMEFTDDGKRNLTGAQLQELIELHNAFTNLDTKLKKDLHLIPREES